MSVRRTTRSPCFQFHPGHVPAERGVAPEHVDQAHALALEQLHLVDVAPDQRGALGHGDLGEELRPRLSPGQHGRPWSAVGQEAAAENEVDHAPATTTIPMGVISKIVKGSIR
jgi:hypothetical protein